MGEITLVGPRIGDAKNNLHHTYWYTPRKVGKRVVYDVEELQPTRHDTLIQVRHESITRTQLERRVQHLLLRGFKLEEQP